MSSDDDTYEPRSLAARIWEREWLRKLGLEDVEWEAHDCCPFCNRPRRKKSGQQEAHDHAHATAHDVEKDGPASGTRARPARSRKKPQA